MGQDPDEIRREIAETRDRMSETVDAIGYKADVPSRVRENLSQRVETVKETITNAVGVAGDAMTSATGTVREQLSNVRDSAGNVDVSATAQQAAKSARDLASIAAQNPIGLALAALAVGFLAGLVVPMSDLERTQAENVGDALRERAQDAVNETTDKVISAVTHAN
jgi:ElaB/YqjD/DUF883 family membrane-anchored ribosome-binding protein